MIQKFTLALSARSSRKSVKRNFFFGTCFCVVIFVYIFDNVVFVVTQKRKVTAFFSKAISKPPLEIVATSMTPIRRVHDVDCAAIFANDRQEIDKASNLLNSENFRHKSIDDGEYVNLTKNCDIFKMQRGYYNYKLTLEEKYFPIAYSILLYKNVEQAERLLRAIYRPQNIYCFHVDADSPGEVHTAVDHIAQCFQNVFVVSRKEYVVYAGFSRLQADLNCMENLLKLDREWKYFMNLPSQQFPIKTNAEIVKILKVYNGSNDIEGITGGRLMRGRINVAYAYEHSKDKLKPSILKTNHSMPKPPYDITIVKGSAYGIFSRNFVEYIIGSKIARALLDYMRVVLSPDEYYWATLHHNPHIGAPGSYDGPPDKKSWLATYARWGGKCAGKFVRGVCVFGVGDLPTLVLRHELFANKFYVDYQPLAYDCMEEWYFNRSVLDSGAMFNITFYKSLPFIRR